MTNTYSENDLPANVRPKCVALNIGNVNACSFLILCDIRAPLNLQDATGNIEIAPHEKLKYQLLLLHNITQIEARPVGTDKIQALEMNEDSACLPDYTGRLDYILRGIIMVVMAAVQKKKRTKAHSEKAPTPIFVVSSVIFY